MFLNPLKPRKSFVCATKTFVFHSINVISGSLNNELEKSLCFTNVRELVVADVKNGVRVKKEMCEAFRREGICN